jgi:hypothetical protein
MKKQFAMVLLAVFTLTAFVASAEEKNKPLLGEWAYEVSDAPYGYEKGLLVFSEKDGQLACKVKLESSAELQVNNLKVEKNKITFSVMVEYNQVNIELQREGNKLTGKADSPEGPKEMTAVKK